MNMKAKKNFHCKKFILILPLIVYGIDALLNFPVARPLMQSSLAIYLGLILATYLNKKKTNKNSSSIKSIRIMFKSNIFFVNSRYNNSYNFIQVTKTTRKTIV